MADLLLDSLEIQGFRAFKHLTIERLGRVNLIVGKNGVGKTALLEAVQVYAKRGALPAVLDLLEARDELQLEEGRTKARSIDWLKTLQHLYYNRPNLAVHEGPIIEIGPVHNMSKQLIIEVVFSTSVNTGYSAVGMHLVGSMSEGAFPWPLEGRDIDHYRSAVYEEGYGDKSYFLRASGMNKKKLAMLWDDLVLKGLEEVAVTTMHLLEKDIERINFVESGSERIPVAKMRNRTPVVTVSSLGDGMRRMLGIGTMLVNAENGVLLIDEVETGLHYSVQPEMWKLIFETAQRLNVQVFATTHSLDCLRAFEHAASQYGEEESMLISLRRHQEDPERIVAVLADKEKLDTIVHSHIEVR